MVNPGVVKSVVLKLIQSIIRCWLDGMMSIKNFGAIVTDLKPNQADACWYSMRSWIECLFKDAKCGGWQWHQTKIVDPHRAERHWLAIAVATLWLISLGSEADAHLSDTNLAFSSSTATETKIANSPITSPPANSPVTPTRLLSCFRRGFLLLLAHVLNRLSLPMGSLIPQFSASPFFLSSA